MLLFEPQAHRRSGHYPILVAQIARGLRDLGCDVHVLTSRGSIYDSDVETMPGATAVYEMSPRHRAALDWGAQLVTTSRARLGRERARLFAFAGNLVQNLALVAAVRQRERVLGRPGSTIVIMLSRASPVETVLGAPRRGRWIVYKHRRPLEADRVAFRPRWREMAAGRERRRRAADGFVRMVVNSDAVADAWQALLPWMRIEVAPSAVYAPVDGVSRDVARAALGLSSTNPIALMFGHGHPGKDLEVVYRAFSGHDAPARLVIAGAGNGARFDAFRAANPELEFPMITMIDRFVDDEEVRRLYSAADYAVLSFVPDRRSSSMTLCAAIAYGIPVCSSASRGVEDDVRRHRLGLVYRAGDADALRRTAHRMPSFSLDAEGRERFLAQYSPSALARRLLAVAE